jgi:two-component SAPR family response regulator
MDHPAPLLNDKRILLVEDDIVVAMNLRRDLACYGAVAVGPVTDLAGSMEVMENLNIDGTLINVTLDPSISFPITEALDSKAIPFVFVTSVCPYGMPEEFCKYLLGKPNSMQIIARGLFGPR